MTFAEHYDPARHGRMRYPDEVAEARVMDRLAALTEKHGAWDAALILFGTDHGEVA